MSHRVSATCVTQCSVCVRIFASLLSIWLFILCSSHQCYGDPIRLSVPPYAPGNDLLIGQHPISMVLRSAVGGALLQARPDTPSGFAYSFSNALVVGPGGRQWSLRIRSGTLLQSGRELSEADVVYSLQQCTDLKRLGVSHEVYTGHFSGSKKPGRWVTLKFHRTLSGEETASVPGVLSRCVLFDRLNHPVFGKNHGQGTNFSTVGPFYVYAFRPLRSMSLQRRVIYRDVFRTGSEQLEVSVHTNERRALSSLRSGGVDLFFANNQEVIHEVQKDETLRSAQCSIYYVVFRNGLRVICQPELEVSLLSYQ